MRWTRATALGAAVALAAGCAYGVRTVGLQARYSPDSRPDASYYCYDCHGYRFFDPYYDWCVNYGFRYRWMEHPRVVGLYRERYVRIRERHPDYGRYRYREDDRRARRDREDDYESWRRRQREGSDSEVTRGKRKPREQEPAEPARRRREKKDGGSHSRDRELSRLSGEGWRL